MKRHLIQSLTILLLLTISCDTHEIIKKETKGNISLIDPKDEPQLLEKLDSFFATDDANKRAASSRNEIDLTAAIKIIDIKGNKVAYTFDFKNKQSIEFKNFILVESKTSLKGYTLNYLPDRDWVKKGKFNVTDFSGTVVGLNLNGDTISYAVVIKGKAFPKNITAKTNGRVQGGFPLIPDNSGCYELAYSSATGSYFWLDVVCGQGGGSGGNPAGNGGSPSTGGYDPNSPYNGGSNDPTTGGNGNQTGGGGSSSTSFGGTIGVFSPVFLTEEEIEALTDPETKRKAQLDYIRISDGQDGIDFSSMIDEIMRTPNLTVGDVIEINATVNKYYLNLRGRYIIAVYDPWAKAARFLIELALIETGTEVLFGATKLALSTRYGILVTKAGGVLSSALVAELRAAGVKFTEADLKWIFKNSDGKIVFLEKGNATAGFEHILTHKSDFVARGIAETDISDFILQALKESKIVGYQGSGTGRPIYELIYKGSKQRVAITTGSNGFVVGANPVSF
jgi:hypothetical protein